MRPFALLIALLLLPPTFAAEWTTHPRAKAQVSDAALPAPVYDPNQSIEENNLRISNQDPHSYLLVKQVVSRDEVSIIQLVDRQAWFTVNGRAFDARITSAVLEGDGTQNSHMTVYARVKNKKVDGSWLLRDATVGTLRIRNR